MGILDDAIREHLELKRQHGADESELKQLEGEAFGPAERPGTEGDSAALAEAPTEFMQEPGVAAPEAATEGAPPAAETKSAEPAEEPRIRHEPSPGIAELQEGPESDRAEAEAPAEPEVPAEAEAPAEPEAPAEEETPAMEHKAIPNAEAIPDTPAEPAEAEATGEAEGPETEERKAIAEEPTELYDVESKEFGTSEKAAVEEDLAPEAVEEIEAEEEDFFDEKRLSDELDEAMDAPLEPYEDEPVAEPEGFTEDEELPPARSHEDVLEETPDFLEEAPEDDQLWFEQKPPKDFDFDD